MTLLELTAGDLMTHELVTIGRDVSLREAALVMSRREHHCLLVPAADPKRAPGVITMKDVVQVLCEGDTRVVDKLFVRDVMTEPAICVQQGALVVDCIRLMRATGIRSAPVLQATTVVGLLSFTDVLRRFASDAS